MRIATDETTLGAIAADDDPAATVDACERGDIAAEYVGPEREIAAEGVGVVGEMTDKP